MQALEGQLAAMQARKAQDSQQQQQGSMGTPQDSGAVDAEATLRAENARLAERVRALEEEGAGGKLPEETAQKLARPEAQRDRAAAEPETVGGTAEPDHASGDDLRAANEQLSERVRRLEAELAAAAGHAAAAASGQPPALPKSPGKARGFFARTLSRRAPQQQQVQHLELEAAIEALDAKNAAFTAQAAAAEEARQRLQGAVAALETEKHELAGAVASLEARLAAESAPKAGVPEKAEPLHAEGTKLQEGREPDSKGVAGKEEEASAAGHAKRTSAERKVVDVETRLAAALAQADSLRAEKAAADAAAQEADEKLQALAEQQDGLRAQLAAAERRLAQTGVAAEEAKGALEAPMDRGVVVQAAAAAGSENPPARDASAQASPEALRRQLEAEHAQQCQAAEEAAAQLQVSLDAVRRERDALQVQLAAASAQLQAQQAQQAEAAFPSGLKKVGRLATELREAQAALAGAHAVCAELRMQHEAAERSKGQAEAARRDTLEQAATLGAQLKAAEATREAAEKQAAALREEAQGLRAAQADEARQIALPRRRGTMDQSARRRAVGVGPPDQAQPAREPDQAMHAQLAELQAQLTATEAERASLARCLDRFARRALDKAHSSAPAMQTLSC